MAAVHGKGRFAEGDFCCPWGPFLWLLDPGGGHSGVHRGAVGCSRVHGWGDEATVLPCCS